METQTQYRDVKTAVAIMFQSVSLPEQAIFRKEGEMLDEQAKVAYRHRLSELRDELEEAKELGKVERAEQAEEEIDALTRELSRAVGLGGRNRRSASTPERARQSVTKTIKAVLE